MGNNKKLYEKPVIQDLGQIPTGSAQAPMGACTLGNSPSGAGGWCEGGQGVQETCAAGYFISQEETYCQMGGYAYEACSMGGEVNSDNNNAESIT